MTIERLFFYPPLAFGRLGTSDTPLECFYWGEDDNTPHGTGKTTIEPGQTLRVADDGTVSDYTPDVIRFKDRREDGSISARSARSSSFMRFGPTPRASARRGRSPTPYWPRTTLLPGTSPGR